MARTTRPRRGIPTPPAATPRGVVNPDEPPIMWPSAGSGFEADPLSPSGMAQQEWILASHLARRRGGKVVIWVALVLIVASLLSPLVRAIH